MDATATNFPKPASAADGGFDEAKVFNGPNQETGEMGYMKQLTLANSGKYRYVPGKIIIDQLDAKRTENSNYAAAKTSYEALRVTYNDQLAKKKAEVLTVWETLFPNPEKPPVTVPSTPDRPPIPGEYNWLHWPLTATAQATDEVSPEETMGGWGANTAGMISAAQNSKGKSYGLFGPSNTITTTSGGTTTTTLP
jgi:hypothetical protein